VSRKGTEPFAHRAKVSGENLRLRLGKNALHTKKGYIPCCKHPKLAQNIAKGSSSSLPSCLMENVAKTNSSIPSTQVKGILSFSSQIGLNRLFFTALVRNETLYGEGVGLDGCVDAFSEVVLAKADAALLALIRPEAIELGAAHDGVGLGHSGMCNVTST